MAEQTPVKVTLKNAPSELPQNHELRIVFSIVPDNATGVVPEGEYFLHYLCESLPKDCNVIYYTDSGDSVLKSKAHGKSKLGDDKKYNSIELPECNKAEVAFSFDIHAFPPNHIFVFNLTDVSAKVGEGEPSHEDAQILARTLVTQSIQRIEIEPASVDLGRTRTRAPGNLALWVVIRNSTNNLKFNNYFKFMNVILCGEELGNADSEDKEIAESIRKRMLSIVNRRFLPFTDTDAYRILKIATESFVLVNAGVRIDTNTLANSRIDVDLRRVSASDTTTGMTQLWDEYLSKTNGSPNGFLPYLDTLRQRLQSAGLKDVVFPGPYIAGSGFDQNQLEGPADSDSVSAQSCTGIIKQKLTQPLFLELIWSYWHEQGMQVQTMHAIRNRFQNMRSGQNDPLASMEIGALRPLNNIFWGYLQDEQHRLTIVRRCHEYDHHYGLTLQGRAVPAISPADSRVKFLEALHNLLYLATVFFKEDDDTTRIADSFPILNALKEVHFILSEGAHNQFGELPATSRIEMMMEQWLLAREELREFLPSRESVAYPEEWMGRVDAMKTLQGWTSTSVMFFHDLGRFGEQLLLSIRYDDWNQQTDAEVARIWARFWRSEIYGYIHAYRVVTGVDLAIEPTESRVSERRSQPSVLLARRWEEQRRLGAATTGGGMRVAPSPTAGVWAQPRTPRRRG